MAKEGVYLDSTFTFKQEDGFAVAAAIWHGDESLNTIEEDPEIGQIKFVVKHWGDPSEGPKFRKLATRTCRPEDMSVSEGETRNEYGFFSFDPDTVTNEAEVKDRLVCADEPYEIKGHYDSYSAANLMVVYEVCDPKQRTCKSKEKIEEALAYSYLLLVENRQYYSH